jgi:aminobenzoyl-glutamate transport protein
VTEGTAAAARRGRLERALDALERAGNRLPHPITLFAILAGAVIVASAVTAALGVAVTHPADGSTLRATSLLDAAGVRRMLTEAVRNFTGFAPLGTVLVAMIGIGVAEASGFIAVAMRALVMAMPGRLLTPAVVFTGVMANQAADAGLVVLPPVAAMLYAASGRHPLAGIAAAFAGVAGGFSANLLPSTLDVLLAGLSQEALDASKLLPGYQVQILGNWWFLAAATPVLMVVGTWVTHRFVEPRLGRWQGAAGALEPLTPAERRGLRAALVASLAVVAAIVALAMPGSPLRGEGDSLIRQLEPMFASLVVLLMLAFFVPGLVYGMVAGTIRSDHDVARMTGDTLATMGGYIALAFVAAQFTSWFAWSNLGAVLAISGAGGLRQLGLQGPALLVGFVLLAAFINLFITSASAKWAVMAPIFVPMLALLGFTPEGTQAVFRVGDSCTNIVTPLMPYMPFVLTAAQRYVPRAGAGTLIALMLPYSATFLVMWTTLLLLFYALGWPLGPGVGFRLP